MALVLGITADIGRELATRLISDGWQVIGLGRDSKRLSEMADIPGLIVLPCNLGDRQSIERCFQEFETRGYHWDLFVSSVGTMKPIGRFFSLDFDAFEESVKTNSLDQLRVLHRFWPRRRMNALIDVMFLAGGGTNNPFTNYSAYCVSKIALIKMCELLHDEEKTLNAFIIGPGYTQTKIHNETLNAGRDAAGESYGKTRSFVDDKMNIGTSFDDIYSQMRWCMTLGRDTAGGRNFSTVHDPWRDGGMNLSDALKHDENAFRLRRQVINTPEVGKT